MRASRSISPILHDLLPCSNGSGEKGSGCVGVSRGKVANATNLGSGTRLCRCCSDLSIDRAFAQAMTESAQKVTRPPVAGEFGEHRSIGEMVERDFRQLTLSLTRLKLRETTQASRAASAPGLETENGVRGLTPIGSPKPLTDRRARYKRGATVARPISRRLPLGHCGRWIRRAAELSRGTE